MLVLLLRDERDKMGHHMAWLKIKDVLTPDTRSNPLDMNPLSNG